MMPPAEMAGALQAWMREKQPRCWRSGASTNLREPEAYRRELPNARLHILDAGHFALDTAFDEPPSCAGIGRLPGAERRTDAVAAMVTAGCPKLLGK
jgi:hypothetical protein